MASDKNHFKRILPICWPPEVKYISDCIEEQEFENYSFAKERSVVEESLTAGISCYLEVKEVPKGHPAYDPKQESFGAFARQKIEAGTPIGEYVGLYLPKDKDVNSKYKLSFNSSCDIDARLAGNETRFINHYKGIRSTPNIKYEWVEFEEEAHAVATTIEVIEQGEEVVVDYGPDFNKYKSKEANRILVTSHDDSDVKRVRKVSHANAESENSSEFNEEKKSTKHSSKTDLNFLLTNPNQKNSQPPTIAKYLELFEKAKLRQHEALRWLILDMLRNARVIVALTVPKTKREPERKQGNSGYGDDFEAFGWQNTSSKNWHYWEAVNFNAHVFEQAVTKYGGKEKLRSDIEGNDLRKKKERNSDVIDVKEEAMGESNAENEDNNKPEPTEKKSTPDKSRKRETPLREVVDKKEDLMKEIASKNISSITVPDLMNCGLIEEGDIVEAKVDGKIYTGVLTKDGTIKVDDKEFSNPTSFWHNFSKTHKSGWKHVKIQRTGESFYMIKEKLLEIMESSGSSSDSSSVSESEDEQFSKKKRKTENGTNGTNGNGNNRKRPKRAVSAKSESNLEIEYRIPPLNNQPSVSSTTNSNSNQNDNYASSSVVASICPELVILQQLLELEKRETSFNMKESLLKSRTAILRKCTEKYGWK